MITSEGSIRIFISDEKNKAHRGWITCHGPTLMSAVLGFTPCRAWPESVGCFLREETGSCHTDMSFSGALLTIPAP